jgi:hypothetical protein
MSIKLLDTILGTSVAGISDKTLEVAIAGALEEYTELRGLFTKLVPCTVMSDGVLLADPKVYNQMVKVFNKTVDERRT